ncbi:leucine-rich repeat-containing protein 70-like [Cryptotermes secundus]|uniref:leucine-rich repeat-containing protein 70-like n=1 Tax=Cryptotermes secundus TaxID=105785 RepID=UPI000CD7C6C4|nr:leucine-rich repeat-containing protein 70-like [Cryptotermes secundus]
MQHTKAEQTRFGQCIFLMILTSAEIVCGRTCLEVCDCFGEENILADCSGKNFNKIPENLNTTLHYIDFSNNSITKIKKYDLSGYKSIRILNLSNNGLNKISKNSFQELVNLKYLYLSGNNILHLPSTVFNKNVNLKKLYLKGNPLSLCNGMSILVSDSITYLDISFCNITILPAASFVTVPNLLALRLDGNMLTNITTEIFEPLQNLKEIYMESETLVCAESSFNEFLNYLEKRGIKYYGPSVCSEECLSTPSTVNLIAPVPTSAVSNQIYIEVPSSIPRTMTGTLGTAIPFLKETLFFLNEKRPTANMMSVTHNPLLQEVSHETQVHEESTSEHLSNSYSSNLKMKSINALTIRICLLCVVLTQRLDSLKHIWGSVIS